LYRYTIVTPTTNAPPKEETVADVRVKVFKPKLLNTVKRITEIEKVAKKAVKKMKVFGLSEVEICIIV
jgi:hypothetical protein